jgi:hypothetical protein
VIATYVKKLSRSWRKRGVGGKVKKFCRERRERRRRAGGTKTDEDDLGGTVGSDLARRFGLGAFSILNAPRCNI